MAKALKQIECRHFGVFACQNAQLGFVPNGGIGAVRNGNPVDFQRSTRSDKVHPAAWFQFMGQLLAVGEGCAT